MEHTKLKNYRLRSESLWVLSGLALASCGGGGGGGGSRPVITADTQFFRVEQQGTMPAHFEAFADESEVVSGYSIGGIEMAYTEAPTAVPEETYAKIEMLLTENAVSDGEITVRRVSDLEFVVSIVGNNNEALTLTFTLDGPDKNLFRLVAGTDGPELETKQALDADNPLDMNIDNEYVLTATIKAEHSSLPTAGVTFMESFTFNIPYDDGPGQGTHIQDYNGANDNGIRFVPIKSADSSGGPKIEYEAFVYADPVNKLEFVSLKMLITEELELNRLINEGTVVFGNARVDTGEDHEATITLDVTGSTTPNTLVFTYMLSGTDVMHFKLMDVGTDDVRIVSNGTLAARDPQAQRGDDLYEFTTTVTTADSRIEMEFREHESKHYLYVLEDPSVGGAFELDATLPEIA